MQKWAGGDYGNEEVSLLRVQNATLEQKAFLCVYENENGDGNWKQSPCDFDDKHSGTQKAEALKKLTQVWFQIITHMGAYT